MVQLPSATLYGQLTWAATSDDTLAAHGLDVVPVLEVPELIAADMAPTP